MKNNFCPYCYKTQIKRLNKSKFYNKYSCWNKECKYKGIPFGVLNFKLKNEENFDSFCEVCQEPFIRKLKVSEKGSAQLIFKCNGKLCETESNPHVYNLNSEIWEGNIPKFRVYEEEFELQNDLDVQAKKKISAIEEISLNKDLKESELSLKLKHMKKAEIDETIPLLTMNSEEYDSFLQIHNNKVVVLVDLPNFVRTMRQYHSSRFIEVLKKSHKLLIKSIQNLFNTEKEYIIRYFSKPDDDLSSSNNLVINFCKANPNLEYYHLLKLGKAGGFSDIDNYLIANGVEIIEKCSLRGFIIVSSDKDYLPVMRIAKYRGIKSYIMGINTPQIYEQYQIEDIKFLGIMKYFET
jgi:hypothetical protein